MALTRNELKNLRSLKQRRGRRELSSFLAEGVRVLEEATKHEVRPDLIVYDTELSERGMELVSTMFHMGVRAEEVEAHVIEAIADTKHPQGLVAVFPTPKLTLDDLSDARRILLCDGVSDPGNVGTLIRSALAFDTDAIISVGDSVDPWSPKVVRSAAGAMFGIRIHRGDSTEAVEWLNEHEAAVIVSASPSDDLAAATPESLVGRKKICLAIGSEATGVSAELRKIAVGRWSIEMNPKVESLNAGVAGSILLKELRDRT